MPYHRMNDVLRSEATECATTPTPYAGVGETNLGVANLDVN